MKRAAALLLGLALAGCRGHGAEGLETPGPMDMSRLVRPDSPNTALAAPAGFTPAPDLVTAAYAVLPERLFAAVRAVAEAQPRVYKQVVYANRLQAHYVVRSAILNFPDLVTVQVNPDATLVLWSRSVYGASDLGVNRKRLAAWLAALDVRLAAP